MAALGIDVEDESILASIFRDCFPENWRENADFTLYLSELSSYGVDKLNREPERLAEERAQILQQTQQLAFSNYKTFIKTAECTKEIYRDFGLVEKHVSSLLDKLPGLSEKCRQFIRETEETGASRRMNSLTLNRHTEILEILEIPQLMDTCVRNGYYEEALELTAYVKRLEKKHSSIPVIQGIVNEVRSSAQLMLNQLIQQLRTNIQLPACLRVIGNADDTWYSKNGNRISFKGLLLPQEKTLKLLYLLYSVDILSINDIAPKICHILKSLTKREETGKY
eukprot:g44149.t1